MSSPIQLIVGLGNPGADYERTRHNAGAWWVEALTQAAHAALRQEPKFHGRYAAVTLFGKPCHLFIPTTFMNHSGQAVKALCGYYKIAPEAMLVAHDEIDLPVGDIRLKFDGGHGGHNGLRDIIRHLNTHQFHRLRIGVGRPTHSDEVINYVLAPPKSSERPLIDEALREAEDVVSLLLDGQFQKATMQLHTKERKIHGL